MCQEDERLREDLVAAHLAEFRARREEIKQRSLFQHSYILFLLAADGSIGSFAFSGEERTAILVVIPFLTLIIYMLWVHQALVITQIGDYIEHKLSQECSRWLGHEVLTWERERPPLNRSLQVLMKALFLCAHFALTCAIPVLATILSMSPPVARWQDHVVMRLAVWVAVGLSIISFLVYLPWHLKFYRGKHGDASRVLET